MSKARMNKIIIIFHYYTWGMSKILSMIGVTMDEVGGNDAVL